jgi:transcriptional regulator with XRE-family HTH domain
LPPVILTAKNRSVDYPKSLITWGNHIKAKRLDDKLQVKQLAAQLGTTIENIINWEKAVKAPRLSFLPRIIDYLGYCPVIERPLSLGQKVKLKRTYAGIGYEQLANKLGIGVNTILRWEESTEEPKTAKVKNALERYLKMC